MEVPTQRSALELFYAEFFADPFLRGFYGGSGFANLGYWEAETPTVEAACNRLVDLLVGLLPDRSGRILEIACGAGATTRRLAAHFEPGQITAINISAQQIEAARRRNPQVECLQMDAVSLDFSDASFDAVICIEAAFHFATRERFLREARRVLEPGGHLILSDLLFRPGTPLMPLENYLPDVAAYECLVRFLDFTDVVVIDAHREMWHGFKARYREYLVAHATSHGWLRAWRNLLFCEWGLERALCGGLLLSARRPRSSNAAAARARAHHGAGRSRAPGRRFG